MYSKLYFLLLFGEWKLLLCDEKRINILHLWFFTPKKQQNWFFKNFHNSGMIGSKTLGNSSLNCTFNILSIYLQYTLALELRGFGMKCLVTVMPKGHSSTVKVRTWNFPISKIGSNCNSILRPYDSK